MSQSSSEINHSAAVPIAIAHDYLTQRGGAERVVLAMHKAFPEAPIYTTLYNPETTYPEFRDCTIITSPLNKIPLFRKDHRLALPLLPIFSSLLRVKADKALVSTTGWAHGFSLPQKSFIYCHSPARWVYLTDQYLGSTPNPVISTVFKTMRPVLRLWDQRAAARQEQYVANSTTIKQRIFDVYGKDVNILFPPHSVSASTSQEPIEGLEDFMSDGFFMIVSRLLPYKNVQHAIEAFSDLDQKLLVVGSGPMKDELQAMSTPNVRFVSNISDSQMRYAYAHSKAVLAISHEDFGLTPLEAGSFGKPVIALRAGGFLDTISEGVNGTFIDTPSPEAIHAAVATFDEHQFNAQSIQSHVEKFSEERFIDALRRAMQ